MTATLRRARPTMQMPALLAPAAPRPRRRTWLLGVFALAAVVTVAGAARWWSDGPAPATPDEQLARVQVVRPVRSAKSDVVLPATVQPYQAADLHARVNGYVKSWKADLGDKVKAGDVLAEIDAPELDQEVRQAEAQLKQGEADLKQARAELDEARSELALAEANVTRSQANLAYATEQQSRIARLVTSRAASKEEYDGAIRDREARRAELEASRSEVRRRKTALLTREATIGSRESAVSNRAANLQRLRELQGFERIVAPFDGAVVRRKAEVGMLVQAGSEPLYRLWRNDVLRVHVNVPQSYADAVRPGASGWVIVPERPGREFTAVVSRTARAVEPISRTLLVELELPNADEQLLPGIYAQVRLSARRGDEGVLVPSAVLLMRSEGPHVVAVTPGGNTLRVVKVRLGRDLGSKVEVIEGVAGDERLVLNPTDDVSDGQRVVVNE